MMAAAEVRAAWPGGPSRLWSAARRSQSQIALATGGYGGLYVCQGCGRSTVGVYRVMVGSDGTQQWVCGDCRAVRSHQARRGEPSLHMEAIR